MGRNLDHDEQVMNIAAGLIHKLYSLDTVLQEKIYRGKYT